MRVNIMGSLQIDRINQQHEEEAAQKAKIRSERASLTNLYGTNVSQICIIFGIAEPSMQDLNSVQLQNQKSGPNTYDAIQLCNACLALQSRNKWCSLDNYFRVQSQCQC